MHPEIGSIKVSFDIVETTQYGANYRNRSLAHRRRCTPHSGPHSATNSVSSPKSQNQSLIMCKILALVSAEERELSVQGCGPKRHDRNQSRVYAWSRKRLERNLRLTIMPRIGLVTLLRMTEEISRQETNADCSRYPKNGLNLIYIFKLSFVGLIVRNVATEA
jgi:hypothetical protein